MLQCYTGELAIVTSETTYGNVISETVIEAVTDTEVVDITINRTRANGITDVSTIVDDIVYESPDTIIAADRDDMMTTLLDSLTNSDQPGNIVYVFGTSNVDTFTITDDIDLYTVGIWSPNIGDQHSEDFVDLYVETYDQLPSLESLFYCDGINLISTGLADIGNDPLELENCFDTDAHFMGVQGEYSAAGELIRNPSVFQVESDGMNEENCYVLTLES